jgi:bifunctional DNA-binding transcriptional regulator/antitoxin component of YhaV-PrlF toxin-antitoxin module
MESKSQQRVIQIGSSIGVTIPAREARFHGIKAGDKVQLVIARDKKGNVLVRMMRLSWWRRLFSN